jgi:glutathione peroxidase
MTSAHDFSLTSITGGEQPLGAYAGKVIVLVNVASRCGYTKQYKGLEALWRAHKDEGVVVVGVPCNQFGAQEPGSDAEIQQFCQSTYDVTFPMSSKVDVNGDAAHPLYRWLTAETGGPIAWNFAKFVIGTDGAIVARLEPGADPQGSELMAALAKATGVA